LKRTSSWRARGETLQGKEKLAYLIDPSSPDVLRGEERKKGRYLGGGTREDYLVIEEKNPGRRATYRKKKVLEVRRKNRTRSKGTLPHSRYEGGGAGGEEETTQQKREDSIGKKRGLIRKRSFLTNTEAKELVRKRGGGISSAVSRSQRVLYVQKKGREKRGTPLALGGKGTLHQLPVEKSKKPQRKRTGRGESARKDRASNGSQHGEGVLKKKKKKKVLLKVSWVYL